MSVDVYTRIAAVSADLSRAGISKDRTNQQQNYRFRGIDDVYNALAPLLATHQLVILPRILTRSAVERTSKSGTLQFFVVVEAEFDFVAVSDGSKHVVRTFGEAQDSADKATNKAMSAAYKYAAFQTFCIPTEGEDADATTPPESVVDTTTGEEVAAPPTRPTKTNTRPAVAGGYRYIDEYREENGWHHVEFFDPSRKSAGEHYKTKLAKFGAMLARAHRDGIPVVLEISPNKKPGEPGWVNGVDLYHPPIDSATRNALRSEFDDPAA